MGQPTTDHSLAVLEVRGGLLRARERQAAITVGPAQIESNVVTEREEAEWLACEAVMPTTV